METEAGRGKRGASYMDQYDDQYDTSAYTPSANKKDLTGCAKFRTNPFNFSKYQYYISVIAVSDHLLFHEYSEIDFNTIITRRCSKHTLFAVNFVMLLIGVALVVVVFFVKENNEASGGDLEFTMSDTIVYLCVSVGAFIIIVSFLGCVGVC